MPGNSSATIYIGNLDERVHERVLYEIMVQAGPLVEVYIPRSKDSKRHKGYGFAEFTTEESANYALKLFSGLLVLYNRGLRLAISGGERSPQLFHQSSGEEKSVGRQYLWANGSQNFEESGPATTNRALDNVASRQQVYAQMQAPLQSFSAWMQEGVRYNYHQAYPQMQYSNHLNPPGVSSNMGQSYGLLGPPGVSPNMEQSHGLLSPPGVSPNRAQSPGLLSPPGVSPSMGQSPGLLSPPGVSSNMGQSHGLLSPPGVSLNMGQSHGLLSPPGVSPNMAQSHGLLSPPGVSPNRAQSPGHMSPPGASPNRAESLVLPSPRGTSPSMGHNQQNNFGMHPPTHSSRYQVREEIGSQQSLCYMRDPVCNNSSRRPADVNNYYPFNTQNPTSSHSNIPRLHRDMYQAHVDKQIHNPVHKNSSTSAPRFHPYSPSIPRSRHRDEKQLVDTSSKCTNS